MEPCRDNEAPSRKACRDGEGDGFYDFSQCLDYCPGQEVPPGYISTLSGSSEPPDCDADASRHPNADPACGGDADRNGVFDSSSAWACNAPENFTVDLMVPGETLETECGPQPMVQNCSFETNCADQVSLPALFAWNGTDAALSHNCGHQEGDSWVVPYTPGDDCYAQWGPYINGIKDETYQVGFQLQVLGDVNVIVDVAEDAGARSISRLDVDLTKGDHSRTLAGSRTPCASGLRRT